MARRSTSGGCEDGFGRGPSLDGGARVKAMSVKMFSEGADAMGAGGAGACIGAGAGTGAGAGAGGGTGAGAGALGGAGVGAVIWPGIVGIGTGVMLFMVAGVFCPEGAGPLACAADAVVVAPPVLPGGTGGYTLVSFRTGGLPAAPEIGAGRGEFLRSFFTATFGLGTGAGATSGDSSKPMPMFGKGATGLLSCFAGRLMPWNAAGWGCDAGGPRAGEVLSIFGDSCSISTCMGAGGATACCSGWGGRRRACTWW